MDTAGFESTVFTEALSARLSSTSARHLAKFSGWGRTTVTEIVKGRRLPTQVQLEDLLTAASVGEEERSIWATRLAEALREPSLGMPKVIRTDRLDDQPTSAPEPAPRRWWRSRAVGMGVVVLVCLGVGLWWIRPVTREVSGQVRCATGEPVVGVFLVPERGVGTWARVRPGTGGFVVFNGEVGAAGYRVAVGCSGTPDRWATENRSGQLNDPDVRLVCDDRATAVAVPPYYGRCEIAGA